jgi:hypothetical protein
MSVNIYRIAGRLARSKYAAPIEDVVIPAEYSRKSQIPPRESFEKKITRRQK